MSLAPDVTIPAPAVALPPADTALVAAAPIAMARGAADGTIIDCNERFAQFVGTTRDTIVGRSFREFTVADDVSRDLDALAALQRGDITTDTREKRYRRSDGAVVWGRRHVSWNGAQYIVMVEDITREVRQRETLAAISEASRRLAALHEESAILELIPSLLVPSCADLCTLLLKRPDGTLDRVGERCADAQAEEDMRALRAHPARRGVPHPVREVVERGELTHIPDYAAWVADRLEVADDYRAMLERRGPRSSVVVPLCVHGEVLGGLALGTFPRTGRDFTEVELRGVEDLGARIALALANARLLQDARRSRRDAEEQAVALRRLLDQTPALLMLVRDAEEPRIEFMNRKMLELWAGRDQTGRALAELGTERTFVEQIRAAFRTGEGTWHPEVSLALDWDGDGVPEWRTFMVTIQPVRNAAGAVERVMTFSIDISEAIESRRRAESSDRRFRELADAVPQLVWECDPEGHVVYVNRRWDEFTGCDITGTLAINQAVHPDDRPAALERFFAALREGVEYDMEFRVRRRDGAYRWFLARAYPRRADGRIEGWIGSLTDIDEIRRLVATLRETDQRKDEFLAMLAHELRNPLAPILTAVELMRMREGLASAATRERDIIERQTRHLVRLVEDLLDVSRITRGRVELRPESVELATVVQRAVDVASAAAHASGHRIEVTLPPHAVTLRMDPVRMAQVVGNLLSNAVRYSPPGSRVRLCAEATGAEAVIRVQDEGHGIDAANLERIFELFVQVDPGVDRRSGGLGIGLTIVKRLVEMHGGRVEARSDGPGKGSEFVVRLPLAAAGTPAPREEPPAALPGELEGRRLLVVDDNADAATMLAEVLRALGAEVCLAHDGHSAIAHGSGWRPDAVLLDIGLPEADGFQVARALREAGSAALLVAITGYGQDTDRERASAAGFDAHFTKPVEIGRLRAFLAGRLPR